MPPWAHKATSWRPPSSQPCKPTDPRLWCPLSNATCKGIHLLGARLPVHKTPNSALTYSQPNIPGHHVPIKLGQLLAGEWLIPQASRVKEMIRQEEMFLLMVERGFSETVEEETPGLCPPLG